MRFLYNVYDEEAGGKRVLERKSNKELCEFFQIHAFNHLPYTSDGKLYHGRYRIEHIEQGAPEEKAFSTQMADDFPYRWDKVIRMFVNCIWVKEYTEGVKKLAV